MPSIPYRTYFIDRLILDGIALVFLGDFVDQPILLDRL
jgi:hypothetical protein